jgi:ketosteroid isomerase-like protein
VLSPDDRLAINDLLTRADNAASRRDVGAYVSCFTEDVILDGSQGEHHGKDVLRAAVGPIWRAEGPVSAHLTLNVTLEASLDAPDLVIARSVLLIIRGSQPPSIHSVHTITQQIVRRADNWLVQRRTVA